MELHFVLGRVGDAQQLVVLTALRRRMRQCGYFILGACSRSVLTTATFISNQISNNADGPTEK
jgi:hypothetical protein